MQNYTSTALRAQRLKRSAPQCKATAAERIDMRNRIASSDRVFTSPQGPALRRIVAFLLLVALAAWGLQAAGADARSMLPDTPLDFAQRCADPQVVLCDPLDEGAARGVGITAKTPLVTLPAALRGSYRDWRWCRHVDGVSPDTPELDHDVKTSGSGSVRFAVTPNSSASSAGYCQINFTPDNSVQFGEGDSFFVQYRVRFSCDLLFTDCDPASRNFKKERRAFRSKHGKPTTFKVSIINGGDHPQLDAPVNACTFQQLVVLGASDGTVQGFHSCGWYDGHTFRLRPNQANGRTVTDRQPIRKTQSEDVRGCYNRDPTTGDPPTQAWHECILWQADEWMTVTQQVTIGRWADKVRQPSPTSNVRIWVARQGQKPQLVIDYDRNLRRPEQPFMRYGKVWLVPHLTGKDPTEAHPVGHMWFDDLIVSRGPIAPAR
jgi:hypothetical protein